MVDYSWMKPGVKAVVYRTKRYPQLRGEIVTIESYPIRIMDQERGYSYTGVMIEEGTALANKVGSDYDIIAPSCDHLKPLPPDRSEDSWAANYVKNNLILDFDFTACNGKLALEEE